MKNVVGSRVNVHGQTLIVGCGGRLYAPRTSVDAWGRTRQTQKVTKYRIVACSVRARLHRPRRSDEDLCRLPSAASARNDSDTAPPNLATPSPCVVCGQPLTAQRRTKTYCSRACQQKAYRQRGSKGF